jgi:hypothetical protein
MNIDVKILSKLICNRMSVFSDNIIGIDQTYALKGQSVLDNAHLHRNVVDYCNQKNINWAFISLDQEKAFDKIVHKFLFKVLEKFNFGNTLLPFKSHVWSIPIILLENTDILLQINLLKIFTSIFIKLIGL